MGICIAHVVLFTLDLISHCTHNICLQLGVSIGRVALILEILQWVEIEIELGLDSPKFTFG